jgi:RNA polymerase sigma-70 factor (ECF subfamily)
MAHTDLSSAPDVLLVDRAADGDVRAFEVLIRRHAPYLRAYATRLTGSPSDADDVAQETLIVAWRRLDSLADGSKFRAWATSILSRKVTDLYRRRHVTVELDDETDSPAIAGSAGDPVASAETGSQLEALSRVLAGLPPGQRQCWLLREVSGFSYEEIGGQLDMDASTVRGKLARARATVSREMGGWR